MKLEIAWLYSDLMNIYGDRGNIITLTQRCHWRGIETNVTELSVGEAIDPAKYDLYFFGGGQDKEQETVAADLQGAKATALHQAVASGAVVLTICGGYQLAGDYYRPFDGPELPGISILDVKSEAGHKRCIGNVIVETEFGELVAFENHSGKTILGPQARPLGKSIVGFGNDGTGTYEGAIQGNVYGCYLHGSLLPKNPHFADKLIRDALHRNYGEVELAPLDDSQEWAAHKAAAQRARETH
jgi:CobQ-like glutamine amidotransferase family enzyme